MPCDCPSKLARPGEFHPLALQKCLELREQRAIFAYLMGRYFSSTAEGSQHATGFADAPLDVMQAITSVGDMRHADVFGYRQQIFHALRKQSAERNLEGQRTYINVIVSPGGRVQIDVVVADADRIEELLAPGVLGEWKVLLISAPTCCSRTVYSARMRRDSRM